MAERVTPPSNPPAEPTPPEFVSAEEYMARYAHEGYEWVRGRLIKLNDSSADEPPARMVVSANEYMERYAHDFYEWVKGELIKMSPVTDVHDLLSGYLYKLLDAYLTMRPVGQIRRAPFVMQVENTSSRREPDIQIVLNTNPGQLTRTAMVGPSDICIEVVSEESTSRDYGAKFIEYEKAGVQEYWILDPIRKAARFNRLSAGGIYADVAPDAEGLYRTPLLPGLTLHVPTLWQEPLPDFFAIGEMVKEMLKE